MEKEIEDLKQELATVRSSSSIPQIKAEHSPESVVHPPPPMDTFMGSEEAVASLMDLASGQEGGSFMRSPNARLLLSRRLGDVTVGQDQVRELFQTYARYTALQGPANMSLDISPTITHSYPFLTLLTPQIISMNPPNCSFGLSLPSLPENIGVTPLF